MNPDEIVESPSALAKIGNPLPIPEHCRFCGGNVKFVNNSELYGRPYGDWPYGYLCDTCKAYCGCHKNTKRPLGTLATARLRQDRSRAHSLFDPLWKSGRMSRGAAYRALADAMGIDRARCHMSWFDQEECQQVFDLAPKLCKKYGVPQP